MSEALPILYSFRRCPYAMRGRMALMVSGAKVELREIILRDKPAAMIEASPKATVPVLDMRHINGDVVDESLALMNWALHQNDPEGWLGGDPVLTEALIAENDGPFKHHLDRYKYATRYEGADETVHRTEGRKFLERLNTQLADKKNLLGDERSKVDIAIFPFVRQFRIADMDWFDALELNTLKAWLARHMESDLFKGVMKKYALWTPDEEGVVFGEGIYL